MNSSAYKAPKQDKPKQQLKVLIVDDHLLFAEGLKVQLQTLASEVDTTIHINGSAALKLLKVRPNFDLIILDLNMPDINGLEMLEQFKLGNITCPVLVVSASLDNKLANTVLESGALGYLGKNANPDAMIRAAKSVLAGENYLDDNLPRIILNEHGDKSLRRNSTDNTSNTIPPRTLEVLSLMSRGHSNKDIANFLDISEATVKWHVSRLFEVFNAKNRTACVAKAARGGFVEVD